MAEEPQTNQEKLIALLKTMFQFDHADLDFGIYRIMAMKHDEIEHFLTKELPSEINTELNGIHLSDKSPKEVIADVEKQAADLGITVEGSPKLLAKYKEAQEELAHGTDKSSIENDIYNHLYDFFSRYYDDGDFISQRRYKDGVYAIPYEGEEVKLYWANEDQYYVKTSEYFKDYSFKTPQGKVVHFKIVEAETDKDNNKSSKNRTFQLYTDNPFAIENDELVMRILYTGDDKKQKDRNAELVASFTKAATPSSEYKDFYCIIDGTADTCILEKQLEKYTARNTFDYFIHKDLKKFLTRELDFYIKNDVIHIDDIETEDVDKLKMYITKAKVIRSIAQKIIAFLAQIEDFQKALFLKKKFVTETNYCMTLDRVPEELYETIAANGAQRNEWVKLFAIDEIKNKKGELETKASYSEPLTKAFLKENQFLVLDTKFFDESFKEKLVDSIDGFDEKLNGLLIHSENFQALNLIKNKNRNQIDGVYIDPPYNATSSEILYKNNYKHSSWMSLLYDRLNISKKLLSENGLITVAIDDYEMPKLWEIMNSIYGYDNHLGTISIRINPKGRMTARKISAVHEYTLVFGNSENANVKKLPVNPEDKTHNYVKDANGVWYLPNNLRKQGVDSEGERSDGTTKERFFPIYYDPKTGKISSTNKYEIEILPIDSSGYKRIWRRDKDVIDKMYESGDIWVNKVRDEYQIYYKFYGGLDGQMVQSIWIDPECSASDYGTKILDNCLGKRELFSYPKAPFAVKRNIQAMSNSKETKILDYFAGSGTTAHAVINLNREDGGNRKYILCEMGEYFDTVTKPRVEKVIYSEDWKDGKPITRKGSSHAFKYISLESYEDSLNNIEFTGESPKLTDQAKEEYVLSYMLKMQSEQSVCLLNIDKLKNPFAYEMKITKNLETKTQTVDLVETFNYLIGLQIEHSYAKVSFDAAYTKGEKGVLVAKLVNGSTCTFKMIEGKQLSGDKVLVIWRTLTGDAEKDNAALDAFFAKKHLNPADFEFNKIYVNGDNNLENIRTDEEHWKVMLIEEEMKKLMFEQE